MKTYLCKQDYLFIKFFSQDRKTNEVVKSYKCDRCDKSFKQSSDLNKHKMTYSGCKPSKCKSVFVKYSFDCKEVN